MNRTQIIENYLNLSRTAQEYEYYWENNTCTESEFVDAADIAHLYYYENGITRDELTEYNDRRRNVVKTSSIEEAKSALNNFFS